MLRKCQRKDDMGQRDEQDFLNERMTQRVDGPFNQTAPIVKGNDGDALGQAR